MCCRTDWYRCRSPAECVDLSAHRTSRTRHPMVGGTSAAINATKEFVDTLILHVQHKSTPGMKPLYVRTCLFCNAVYGSIRQVSMIVALDV